MKVLVSAYACEPGKGSEPGVGWSWMKQISRFVDEVWVITRANSRPVIEEALKQEPLPNVHWVYFDLPYWVRFWKKRKRGVHLYYYLWQIGIYFLARRLHGEVGFDLVHHVTFGNYWMPSFVALLPGPFIWGPVGGGESAPESLYRTFSWRGRIYEYTRSIARWFGEHDPFVRMTAKRTTLALAKTEETAQRLERLGTPRVITMSEVAWSLEEIRQLAVLPAHTGNPFRLLSMGNLLHLKGFHLGIMAFARFVQEFPRSEYWIVGDGPERRNLELLVEELGVSNRVRFWGSLSRPEAVAKLAECNVLVHPSLHDSGGWVCMEAMAAGRPVICLDVGGPALQVTEDTGFKIPVFTPEQVIEGIASAMQAFAEKPDLFKQKSLFSRKRVLEDFTWAKRGEQLKKYYENVIDK